MTFKNKNKTKWSNCKTQNEISSKRRDFKLYTNNFTQKREKKDSKNGNILSSKHIKNRLEYVVELKI